MNARLILGIVLIVVGIAGLGYQGFTYTTRERAVDVGSLHVDVDKQHTVPITPIVGGVALVAGIGLMLMGRGKSA